MPFEGLYSAGLLSTDDGSPPDLSRLRGNGTLWGTGTGNIYPGDVLEMVDGQRIGATILDVTADDDMVLPYDLPIGAVTDVTYLVRQVSPRRQTQFAVTNALSELLSKLNIYKNNLGIFKVSAFGVNTPPLDYDLGEMLVVGSSPTGAFAGHANEIAQKARAAGSRIKVQLPRYFRSGFER